MKQFIVGLLLGSSFAFNIISLITISHAGKSIKQLEKKLKEKENE